MPPKELSAFLAWAEQNEILWDKSAVEIKESKHGLGIYAKRQLEAGYAAVQVPKAIVLSVETTGIANLLADDEVEGYVGLTIGCMYEMSRGAQSPWSAYLALLAKRPPLMATSLSKESREMMKYCEAYNDIESDITDIVEDYNNVVVPFIEKHPEVFTQQIKAEFFNLEAFKAMNAIVSSRSMDVDNFHVSALVPFADFVNHSQTPNADYLTHEDVCEICGALACEHREYEDDSEADDDDDKDSDSDEAPDLAGGDDDDDEAPELADEDDKSSKQGVQEADTSDEDDKWEDEGDSDDEEQEINDTCDIILDDDVEKGEEITRHYGPYPNKILFSKYGFAVEDNTHDTVTIQLEMVRQAAAKILKDDKLVEDRIQWFLESEDAFIGEEDEDDDEDGHEHSDGCCSHDEDGHATDEEHVHTADGGCCGDEEAEKTGDSDDEDAEEDDQDDEDDDFPRDIMYMMHDGSIDDRLLMLLNVLFMEQSQFDLVKEDKDAAMEYFNDIFMRRQQEEHADESDMDDEEEEDEGETMPKPELKPRDAKSIMVRKAVLEAALALVRIRADAFGVTEKTTAEQDLAALKKAKLTGPLYYGGLCVQGEKQILQNALQGYTHFYQEL